MANKRAFDALGGRFATPIGDEQVCISIPVSLIPYILGAIEPLRWPDMWKGDDIEVNRTTGQAENLISRLVTRTLCGSLPCPDCPDCSAQDRATCGGALIVEGDPVGQVVTDVQIVDGKLRVFFGPCCWHDLDVSTPQGATGGTLPDDMWEQDGTPTYSPCGMAAAVQATVNKIVEASFSAMGEFPWAWVGYVQDVVGYDLDNNWLGLLLANVRAGTLGGDSWSNVYDTVEQKAILHNLMLYFTEAGSVGVPTSEAFEEIKQIFKAEMWPESRWQYWDQAINALGRADMDSAAKLGATDASNDCGEAPQFDPAETDPDVNGWYLGIDRVEEMIFNTGTNASVMAWVGTPPEDVYGLFFRVTIPPASGTAKRMGQGTTLASYPAWYASATVAVTTDTSDHLESDNQGFPFIQLAATAPVLASIAAQRGYAGYVAKTGGVDAVTIESPEWLAGVTGALNIWAGLSNQDGFVTELRFIHNINSPSHA